MTSSVQTGINAANPKTTAFLIALVDQPQISTEIINLLISSYHQNNSLIIKPSYQGKSGHPIIIDASLKEEILKLPVELGLNQVTKRHSSNTILIEVNNKTILLDFDTPEDYERHKKDLQS
jgi:molybdenum cofactor cytidylyltransferase